MGEGIPQVEGGMNTPAKLEKPTAPVKPISPLDELEAARLHGREKKFGGEMQTIYNVDLAKRIGVEVFKRYPNSPLAERILEIVKGIQSSHESLAQLETRIKAKRDWADPSESPVVLEPQIYEARVGTIPESEIKISRLFAELGKAFASTQVDVPLHEKARTHRAEDELADGLALLRDVPRSFMEELRKTPAVIDGQRQYLRTRGPGDLDRFFL